MAIKFKNVSLNNKIKKLDLIIKENEITSIIGEYDKLEILKLLKGDLVPDLGTIKINSQSLIKETKKEFKNLIYICTNDLYCGLCSVNILEDIKRIIKEFDIEHVIELLIDFNLDEKILAKNYLELTMSEMKKVSLIITFLKNTDIIIYENPTSYLDNKARSILIKKLKRLKKEKTIIIVSMDTQFVLEVSNRVIMFDKKNKLIDGDKYFILANEKLLKQHKIQVPEIIKFINAVDNKKNIKLGYRDSINDTIKDVYRNAK